LVEDHAVRFASSLRDPTAVARPGRGVPVTLMADPAFDRSGFPELERLPGAAAEVEAIGRLYAGARKLDGADAHAEAIMALLRRGGVAHFAGHAVFDDARPEQSFLVAATGREETSARITAAEIEQMDLRQLRLVVLSACQTARAQAGRSGGFAGLAGAFLAAGAGGVVGSLWRVDDESTRTLMERFHATYRESGDAGGALRQAQLQMLRSTDPALRSPAAWAGFRYAGS
jgi:CHAT domain-containing protein